MPLKNKDTSVLETKNKEEICIKSQGVLPYVGYIGMRRCAGYGFEAV